MGEQNPAISRDIQWLLKVMLNHWNNVFASVFTNRKDIDSRGSRCAKSLGTSRTFSPDDAYRALDTAERLLRAVMATEQASALKQRKEDCLLEISSGQPRGILVDVLIVGYSDPKPQNETPIATRRNNVEHTVFSCPRRLTANCSDSTR